MDGEFSGDYRRYVELCAKNGLKPLSAARFAVCLKAWRTGHAEYDALDLLEVPRDKRKRLMRRWSRLNRLAELANAEPDVVTMGATPATAPAQPATPSDGPSEIEYTGEWYGPRPGWSDEPLPSEHPLPDDPPPPPTDGAPGVREPRTPLDPVLIGTSARAYPPTTPPRDYAT